MSKCYVGSLDATNLVGQLVELFFLTTACVVKYTGFPLAVLTFGFPPLYVFAYYVLRHKSDISRRRKIMYGTAAFLLTVILSGVFFITTAVLHAWG